MIVLIGSQALNYYKPLGRKLHDTDFLMSPAALRDFQNKYKQFVVKKTDYSYVFDIYGQVVEIRNPETLDNTDRELLQKTLYHNTIKTIAGVAWVPSPQILYDIKFATYDGGIDEPKHKYDIEFLLKEYPDLQLNRDFYFKRYEETLSRTSKSNKTKFDFFHKYNIPEYIQHDRLHDLFADLLDINIPTYKRITTAETDIAEELFNKLTHQQKISLMVEESLVLNMERWFCPQMIENGINYRLIDKFYNNNEAMPTYLILKHVCITGLKGEAEYITNFSRANFFEIEQEWCKAKEKIKAKGGFPMSFFEELFELRKKFKTGEKIGLHEKY